MGNANHANLSPDNAPDSYPENSWATPPDSFVVSRRGGSDLSYYGDEVWDLSPYDPNESTRIYFSKWCSDISPLVASAFNAEIKWILFVCIWKRYGRPLTPDVLVKYFYALADAALFCISNSCSLTELYGDAKLLHHFFVNCDSYSNKKAIRAVLVKLAAIPSHERGFPVVGGQGLKAAHISRPNPKQHPPVPTRIYDILLAHLSAQLEEIGAHIDKIVGLIGAITAENIPPELRYRYLTVFPKLVDEYELQEYCDSWGITGVKGLTSHVTQIQFLCKLQILSFSGMRDGEVTKLLKNCLHTFHHQGTLIHEIRGDSLTKGERDSINTHWITSAEGAKAIEILETLALAIYDSMPAVYRNDLKIPLFISPTYLPFVKRTVDEKLKRERTYAISQAQVERLQHGIKKVNLIINEEDLRELEHIDPHRAWRNEGSFNVGGQWPLTYHQLRRSLALYASASGLVSLPSLRRQMKHITQALTLYYGKGSNSIARIVQDNGRHFAIEYQRTQPESEALAYINLIFHSDEKLFGPHGLFAQRSSNQDEVNSRSRSQTMNRFRKGEISYKETPLGGCTEVALCKKRAMRAITSCLACSRAVIQPSKLDRTIHIYRSKLPAFKNDQIANGMAQRELDELIQYREKFIIPKLKGREN